nr:PREDICTED: uncharacterized protein LOC102365017 [Latimeria chalumnae]|eukprot:XP_006010034.2 PREDICTED: uncharacterized protein LOC102365017 [Latimeria chalumnae]
MSISLSLDRTQESAAEKMVAPLTTRTMRRLNAETIYETDTPRTRELKSLRVKRLAYFCNREKQSNAVSCPINLQTATSTVKSIALVSKANTEKDVLDLNLSDLQQQNSLPNSKNQSNLIQETSNNMTDDTTNVDGETNQNTIQSNAISSLNYNLLANDSVPERQKLKHVLRWAQNILKIPCREEDEFQGSHGIWQVNPCQIKDTEMAPHSKNERSSNCASQWMCESDNSVALNDFRGTGSSQGSAVELGNLERCCSPVPLRSKQIGFENEGLSPIWLPEQKQEDTLIDTSRQIKISLSIPPHTTQFCRGNGGDQVESNVNQACPLTKGRSEIFSLENGVQPYLSSLYQGNNLRNKANHVPQKEGYYWAPLEDYSDEEYADRDLKNGKLFFCSSGKPDCADFYISDFVEPLTSVVPLSRVSDSSSSSGDSLESLFIPVESQSRKSKEKRHAWNTSELTSNKTEVPSTSILTTLKCLDEVEEHENMVQGRFSNRSFSLAVNPELKERHSDIPVLDLTILKEKQTKRKDLLLDVGINSDRFLIVKNINNSKKTKSNLQNSSGMNKELDKVTDLKVTSKIEAEVEIQEQDLAICDSNYLMGLLPQNTANDLQKFCPDCASANSPEVNWCMDCGCVMIGISPRPHKDNAKKSPGKITRETCEKNLSFEKGRQKITNAAADEFDFSVSRKVNDVLEPKRPEDDTHGCLVSSDSNLSIYEKYLLYQQQLSEIRNQKRDNEKLVDTFCAHTNEKVEMKMVKLDDQSFVSGKVSQSFEQSWHTRDQFDEKKASDEQMALTANSEIIEKNANDFNGYCGENSFGDVEADASEQENPQRRGQGQEIFKEATLTNIPKKKVPNKAFLETLIDDLKIKETGATAENEHSGKSVKGVKPTKSRNVRSGLTGHKRHWKKSSIAWSSYTHGEVKPRSQNINRPLSAGECRKSTTEHSWNGCPSSGNVAIKKAKPPPSRRPASAGVSESAHQKGSEFYSEPVAYTRTLNAWTVSKYLNKSAFPEKGTSSGINGRGEISASLWLALPDELWFSIFSLLCHMDLSQVAQVCHHFRRLARDETLWRIIRIENTHSLNDNWLINIGCHRPQSITLYRCHDGAQSVTESGLREMFNQCKDSLKELNVTSCSGPRLKGDTVLLVASIYCSHLTSVDISWTGATDSGIIPLVKSCSSLQNFSANGSQITDQSIDALVKIHGKRLVYVDEQNKDGYLGKEKKYDWTLGILIP